MYGVESSRSQGVCSAEPMTREGPCGRPYAGRGYRGGPCLEALGVKG